MQSLRILLGEVPAEFGRTTAISSVELSSFSQEASEQSGSVSSFDAQSEKKEKKTSDSN